MCRALELFASWAGEHAASLAPLIERYGGAPGADFTPFVGLTPEGVTGRSALLGLLRSPHLLAAMTQEARISWLIVLQTARALRDPVPEGACLRAREHHERAWQWLRTRLERASPQALISPGEEG